MSLENRIAQAKVVRNKLLQYNIPYFINGSFAVTVYTKKDLFSDVDFVVSPQDFERVSKLLGIKPKRKRNKLGTFNSLSHKDQVEVVTFEGIYNFVGYQSLILSDRNFNQSRLENYGHHPFRVARPELVILQKLLLNRKVGSKDDLGHIRLLKQYVKVNHLWLLTECIKMGIPQRYLLFLRL